MLAEVQAANAALSAITGAIQNGKDIGDIAGSCAEYFNTKSVIARRSNKRGSKSQIQTFMEFEKLPNIKDVIFIFFISTLTQSACNFSLHFLRSLGC